MARKKIVCFCACLTATVDLLASLLGAPMSGAAAQVAAQEGSGQRVAGERRGGRAPLSAERMAALMATIPDDHPMRDELRLLVRQGPPEGFTAEEWLRLAMKFNFRMPGSQRLRQADGGD